MRTANPALSAKTFQNLDRTQSTMTIQGTVNKSFILIALVFGSAFFTWQNVFPFGWSDDAVPQIPSWYYISILVGLLISFVIIFKKTTAPMLTPVYALVEGATLGVLSAFFESAYPGIVIQAVMCTFGTFGALLMAYKSGVIKATENFKLGVVAATGGIAIVYMIDLVLMFFGTRVPFIHESGTIGILISVGITIVAALNLVLDFDFIEQGAAQGAPKFMEWYAAFGLLVTLIWLYIEMLRLLSKARKR